MFSNKNGALGFLHRHLAIANCTKAGLPWKKSVDCVDVRGKKSVDCIDVRG
jgi:hypothetical protein